MGGEEERERRDVAVGKRHVLTLLWGRFLFTLFIYFWLRWVFGAVHRLCLAAVSNSWLRCVGFLLRWRLLLRSTR